MYHYRTYTLRGEPPMYCEIYHIISTWLLMRLVFFIWLCRPVRGGTLDNYYEDFHNFPYYFVNCRDCKI